jgi:hypothetical protein
MGVFDDVEIGKGCALGFDEYHEREYPLLCKALSDNDTTTEGWAHYANVSVTARFVARGDKKGAIRPYLEITFHDEKLTGVIPLDSGRILEKLRDLLNRYIPKHVDESMATEAKELATQEILKQARLKDHALPNETWALVLLTKGLIDRLVEHPNASIELISEALALYRRVKELAQEVSAKVAERYAQEDDERVKFYNSLRRF